MRTQYQVWKSKETAQRIYGCYDAQPYNLILTKPNNNRLQFRNFGICNLLFRLATSSAHLTSHDNFSNR
ncbi:hypothetical protein PI172_1973 [Prevotella intermedia]|uniref:Uncharacterized protein n=1 Tax=Prevotella intermedia TaxID=28131 RepID=A0AAD1BL55_PREIN|nr:hypothetical protein PI172_1973 [Prevotella intermedia]